MKYDEEIKSINNALKMYVSKVIGDSKYKNKWTKEVLELFISNFVRDEIEFGRTRAEINLYKNLETEYHR